MSDTSRKNQRSVVAEDWPPLLTEKELVRLLRIPEISKAANFNNVIDQLKRFHNLPCIHICRQPLYPLDSVLKWIQEKVQKERR